MQTIQQPSLGVTVTKRPAPKVKAPEVIALHTAFLEITRLPRFQGKLLPLSLSTCYWRLHEIAKRCRRFAIDPVRYLRWVAEDDRMQFPTALLGWATSEVTMQRFWTADQEGKAAPSRTFRHPATHEPVTHLYDFSGQPLLMLPAKGCAVYDASGALLEEAEG